MIILPSHQAYQAHHNSSREDIRQIYFSYKLHLGRHPNEKNNWKTYHEVPTDIFTNFTVLVSVENHFFSQMLNS
jgi:hypothetical protein